MVVLGILMGAWLVLSLVALVFACQIDILF